jgi:hypothetical protein
LREQLTDGRGAVFRFTGMLAEADNFFEGNGSENATVNIGDRCIKKFFARRKSSMLFGSFPVLTFYSLLYLQTTLL